MSSTKPHESLRPKHAVSQRRKPTSSTELQLAGVPNEAAGPTSTKGKLVIAYPVSAGVGLLVGVIYGALSVKSPAPPVIALVGLLAILLGEQIPPFLRHMWGA
jgi:XapX domain-containing protein